MPTTYLYGRFVLSKLISTVILPERSSTPPIRSLYSSSVQLQSHRAFIFQILRMHPAACGDGREKLRVDTIAIAVQSRIIAASDRATSSGIECGVFRLRTRLALLPLKMMERLNAEIRDIGDHVTLSDATRADLH